MRAACVALLVCAFVCLAGCASSASDAAGGSRSTDGPILMPNRTAYSVLARQGDEVTDGFEVLHLDGDRSAVIESVRLVGAEGLELLGSKLAPPDRSIGAVQYMPTWPPADPQIDRASLVDATGARITPATAGYELLVGMRVTGQNEASRVGIRVDYTVGSKKYTIVLPAGVELCLSAEAHRRPSSCRVPDRLS